MTLVSSRSVGRYGGRIGGREAGKTHPGQAWPKSVFKGVELVCKAALWDVTCWRSCSGAMLTYSMIKTRLDN